MDIEKLIERLNQYSQSLIAYKLGADFADACMDAAATISTIQAENKKLRTELEKVKAKRDAAISDLTYIARTYPVDLCDDLVCQYCKHYPNVNTGCPGWTEDDCFEWNGQMED